MSAVCHPLSHRNCSRYNWTVKDKWNMSQASQMKTYVCSTSTCMKFITWYLKIKIPSVLWYTQCEKRAVVTVGHSVKLHLCVEIWGRNKIFPISLLLITQYYDFVYNWIFEICLNLYIVVYNDDIEYDNSNNNSEICSYCRVKIVCQCYKSINKHFNPRNPP